MPATARNYIFLALNFVTGLIGSALLWRTFDSADYSVIHNPTQRWAQYESCSFVFFFLINAIILYNWNNNKAYGALRNINIGVLLYVTCFSTFVNFTTLNNLRIVSQSNTNVQFYMPYNGASNGAAPLDHANWQKYLAGLILGYFSLVFGLLAITIGYFRTVRETWTHPVAIFLYFFGTCLAITGDVVCWSANSVPDYGANDDPQWTGLDSRLQVALFLITTSIMVQWFVVTLGLLTAEPDLLYASTFIFGLQTLYIPVQYFFIESANPNDSDYFWAGPILDWIAAACFAIAAVKADIVPVRVAVAEGTAAGAPKKGEATV